LVAAGFLGGIGETAMQSLLPLYGLAHGFSDAEAARLVAVFSLGEAILVAGLGWMADRFGRTITLLLCSVVAAATSFALPAAMGHTLMAEPVLFLAGGTISGIYTLGVVLIGQDFRGQKLAIVSTGFAMAYSAGSIVGSTPVGYLVDLFGPEALPIAIAICFTLLTVYLLQRGRQQPAETTSPEPGAAAVPELDPAPPVNFDMSFLHQLEPVHVEKTEVGDFHVGNDREWQESNLEEWFRQRAADLGRRAAQRQQAGTDRLEGLETHQAG
jgi:MFS family permease